MLVTSSRDRRGARRAARPRCCERVPLARAGRRRRSAEDELAEHQVFRPAAERGFRVERVGDGPLPRRRAARSSGSSRATTSTTRRRWPTSSAACSAMGVIRALEAAGFEPGDDVEIGGVVFELDPS